MDYTVRPASAEDEIFLQQLFADVHSPEFFPLQLPPAGLSQLLEMQFRAQQSGYSQQFGQLESWILQVGPYPVGRLLVNEGASEIRLVDIALLSAFREHGIGRRVLEELQKRSAASGLPLRLSVRPQNRAAQLYLRLGFVPQGGDAINTEMEWSTAQAAPGEAAELSASGAIPRGEAVPPGATGAYFRSVEGQKLLARSLELDAAWEVELTLTSLQPLGVKQTVGMDPGDSFALALEGPETPILPQGMYEVSFADGFHLELFFGPVARGNGKVQYESVFNRTARLK